MAQPSKYKTPDCQPPDAKEKPPERAFNFFQGCQNSIRPDWGSKVYKFKMPGSLSVVRKRKS